MTIELTISKSSEPLSLRQARGANPGDAIRPASRLQKLDSLLLEQGKNGIAEKEGICRGNRSGSIPRSLSRKGQNYVRRLPAALDTAREGRTNPGSKTKGRLGVERKS